ncbi:hypothetical protein [Actinomadura napierensis]|uniref:Uncharacterized protein n=1 Tax=Actinomadura napierensis TaxID=267854 RepID=A0ABN2YDB4_9ACTN
MHCLECGEPMTAVESAAAQVHQAPEAIQEQAGVGPRGERVGMVLAESADARVQQALWWCSASCNCPASKKRLHQ